MSRFGFVQSDLFGLMCFVYKKYYLFGLFRFQLLKAFVSDLPAKSKSHSAKNFGDRYSATRLKTAFAAILPDKTVGLDTD